jgi:hypothetical protein
MEIDMTSKFIESNKEFWGPEFATSVNIEYKPEHDKIVEMSCYTMCYYIADNFRDGEFRTEILKQFGVEL